MRQLRVQKTTLQTTALQRDQVTGVTRKCSRPQSVLFPVSTHEDYPQNLRRSSKHLLSPNHVCQSALLRTACVTGPFPDSFGPNHQVYKNQSRSFCRYLAGSWTLSQLFLLNWIAEHRRFLERSSETTVLSFTFLFI